MQALSLIFSLLLSPQLSAQSETTAFCYLNITLSAEAYPYFIEKGYDQWKSDASTPAYLSCSDEDYNHPVEIVLSGRGYAYGFGSNSRIRLSIMVPQDDLVYLLNRNLDVWLHKSRLIFGLEQLKRAELHIDNSLSENEIKSIAEANILIRQLPKK